MITSKARTHIEFLETLQEKYEHPERFTIPLPSSSLLELVSSGSTGITIPGSGHLWLTIVALPPAPTSINGVQHEEV